jgi:hypothetical protein
MSKNGTAKKKNRWIGKVCVSVIGLGLVGWLSYSAIFTYNDRVVNGPVVADITAVDEYVTELNAE